MDGGDEQGQEAEHPDGAPDGLPRITVVAFLQFTAVFFTLLFFVLLIYSYLFPALSFYVVDAETERMSFTVEPEHTVTFEMIGMTVISSREERGDEPAASELVAGCSDLQVTANENTTISLLFESDVPIIDMRFPSDADGAGSVTQADGNSARGVEIYFTPRWDRDTEKRVDFGQTEDALRIRPNASPKCFRPPKDGSLDMPRFRTLPFAGTGFIGDPELEEGRPYSTVRTSGSVEIFSSGSWLCPIQVFCPITDVTIGERTLPFGAALRPVKVAADSSYLADVWNGVDYKNPDAVMYGHITQGDGVFNVTAMTHAHALEVTAPNFPDTHGFIRVGIMEIFYAEPMLAVLLGFFPMTTLSLSILNKQGVGPFQLVRRGVRGVRSGARKVRDKLVNNR